MIIFLLTIIYLSSFWFYIFPSGAIQPGFAFIILCLPFLVMYSKNIKIPKVVIIFALFLFAAFFVNTVSLFLIQEGVEFLVNNLQIIYAILILIFFTIFFESKLLTKLQFGHTLSFFLVINIVLWGLGLGNYEFFPRYNGFLTDPNQFSFATICFSFLAISMYKKKSSRIFVWFMAAFLIILSASRSGLIGFMGGTFLLLPNRLKILFSLMGATVIFIIFTFVESDLVYRFSSIDILDRKSVV